MGDRIYYGDNRNTPCQGEEEPAGRESIILEIGRDILCMPFFNHAYREEKQKEKLEDGCKE
jgi:hypothetical protein